MEKMRAAFEFLFCCLEINPKVDLNLLQSFCFKLPNTKNRGIIYYDWLLNLQKILPFNCNIGSLFKDHVAMTPITFAPKF